MHSPHIVTVRSRTLALALFALIACAAIVLAPRPARAEGSASLLTSGGSRAFLEYRNDFTQNSSIRRRTLVYVWAQPGPPGAPVESAHNGYNTIRWTAAGLAFAAVSDVNRDDLRRLVALIQAQ